MSPVHVFHSNNILFHSNNILKQHKLSPMMHQAPCQLPATETWVRCNLSFPSVLTTVQRKTDTWRDGENTTPRLRYVQGVWGEKMSRIGRGNRSLAGRGSQAGQIRPKLLWKKQAKSINVINFLVSSNPSQFSEWLGLAGRALARDILETKFTNKE